jgi:hypothetical protein
MLVVGLGLCQAFSSVLRFVVMIFSSQTLDLYDLQPCEARKPFPTKERAASVAGPIPLESSLILVPEGDLLSHADNYTETHPIYIH